MAQVTLTLRARWPWWLPVAAKAMVVWAWLRLPTDADAMAGWIADRIKFEAVET